jgi:cytochrome c556
MKHIGTLISAALTGLVISTSAAAQAKPEVVVKQRQAAMVLQGKYFGPMAAMAQDKAPFKADVVAYNASLLDALSRMPWDGFDASTQGVKSATLPAAFTDTAKFKAAQDQFNSAVAKLVAASKGSDMAATKAAIGGVGKTCGGCHDNFRQKP